MADLGERIVAAAMAGVIDTEVFDQLIEIHTRVVRAITCPTTGEVLDSRTAHLITAAPADRSSIGTTVVHHSAAPKGSTSAWPLRSSS